MSKKPMSALGIANLMADAAHKKSHAKAAPDMDADSDLDQVASSDPAPKKKLSGTQEGAVKAKKKASMK